MPLAFFVRQYRDFPPVFPCVTAPCISGADPASEHHLEPAVIVSPELQVRVSNSLAPARHSSPPPGPYDAGIKSAASDAAFGATARDREEAAARIPSLDGIRAISISLVLLSHLNGTHGFSLSHSAALEFTDLGSFGVRVFFVISGFLITGLLLKEVEKTGSISLPRFYFRRTLRIFPAYYFFVLVVAIAALFGVAEIKQGDLVAALTYTMNYHWTNGWDLGHAWSLAVEEQFYLLWPAALFLGGVRRGLWVALAFVLLAPVIRIALLIPAGGASGIGTRFETVGDAIAVGCLLALLRSWLWDRSWYRAVLQSRLFAIAPLMVVAFSTLPVLALRHVLGLTYLYVGMYSLVGITVMNVGIAMCIDWAIRNSQGRVGRCLNWAPVAYIGTISYSLYLWQQLFLNRNQDHLWVRFPLNVLLAFACAMVSYHLIEKPVLRARQSLERRWRRRVPMVAKPGLL